MGCPEPRLDEWAGMSTRLNRSRRLRVAEDFAPEQSWRRSLRRVRARGPFRDPLGQGIVAASGAILTAGTGLWVLRLGHSRAALWMFGAAAIGATIYLALAARAFKRDKAVQFWQERRELRLSLGREEAYRKLLVQALAQVYRFQGGGVSRVHVEEALGRMVDLTFRVFAPVHDDIAVLLVHQVNGRCEIVHSALSQGSRWHVLRSGKHCILEGDLTDRLQELAPHHRASLISTSARPLWFVVLHDSQLSNAEEELLHPLAQIFESIANQTTLDHMHGEFRPLRALG